MKISRLSISDGNLANIHTFICVARYLSFAQAADKLCLTPSAISHRITRLENQLGFKLFHRFARKINLTSDGERLFAVLSEAFEKINDEIRIIHSHELSGPLTLFSHPSIAKCWLIPHLADFTQRYPSIALNIYTGNEVIDFQRQSIDAALYYAKGEFTGLEHQKLMNEMITPVCTPEYAKQYNLLNNPTNLVHCTLLHDAKAWHYSAMNAEWHTWFEQSGLEVITGKNTMSFDSSDLAISAAINHVGIAMGRGKLIERWLDNGQLITPFGREPIMTKYGYYLVWPFLEWESPRLKVFKQWLSEHSQ